MKQKRQYYSLIDKVHSMENLYEAWLKVKKNNGSGGIDGVTIERFEKNLNLNLREIQRLLQLWFSSGVLRPSSHIDDKAS